EKAMKLLAADVATLAPAEANTIILIKEAFTPTPNLILADVVLADFDGSEPKDGIAGAQPEGQDPNTGDFVIDIAPSAGGWRWETTGTTNLPQTIYGFCLTDADGTVLLASALLPSPQTLNLINQRIDLGDLPTLTMLRSAIS